MTTGIIIFESGEVQQFGELKSAAGIIKTLKELVPHLESQEAKRILDTVSDDDLEQLIKARKTRNLEK